MVNYIQSMMGTCLGGPFWLWLMFFGMSVIGLLTIVVLVLLIIWFIKQIKK